MNSPNSLQRLYGLQGNGGEGEDYQVFLSGEDSGIVKNGAWAVGFGVQDLGCFWLALGAQDLGLRIEGCPPFQNLRLSLRV